MSLQSSLFDSSAAPALGPLGTSLTRTRLDSASWVDHQPGWVSGSDALFETVTEAVAWRAERRQMYDRVVDVPRLVSWYDAGAELPHAVLSEARLRLSAYYRDALPEGFATAGLCLYRDGTDSVAWHGDTIGRGRIEDTLVAIVSLGAPRALLLRPRTGGASLRFMLGHGDLLVMGGACQRTWEHAVPKTARSSGPRISIQFRPPGVR
ncbi:MAG: alpha-ketoglutarate-dependent dioxygenase AlkB [Actinomycetes bacterium]